MLRSSWSALAGRSSSAWRLSSSSRNSPRSSAGPAAPPEPDDGLQGASPRPVGERGGVHSRRRRCGNGARLDASHRRRRRRLRAPPPQSGSVGARAHALPPLPSWRAPGLPFRWDAQTLERGLNFTLTTDLGALDLLGEITGGGRYAELLAHTIMIRVFGVDCRCLTLERLIDVKRAAGRPKDLEAIAELEAIREERDRRPDA